VAPSASRLRHAPGLDGVRALAVAAVVAYHVGTTSDTNVLPGGFLGVDVFFVLSGYLITSLLIVEARRTRHISIGQFYLRRARRLLPALYALLLAVAAVGAIWLPQQAARIRGDIAAAVTYSTNWWLIAQNGSYFGGGGGDRPQLLTHLWSLAVEEQFYLVWPIVLVVCFRIKAGRGVLLPLVLLGVAASTTAAAMLYVPFSDPSRSYYGTDTRALAPLLGAALALTVSPWQHRTRLPLPRRLGLDLLGLLGLFGLGVITVRVHDTDPMLYGIGFLVIAALGAVVVGVAGHPGTTVGRVLGQQPLRWLGDRSYAIYLWHWPICALTRPTVDLRLTGWADAGLRVAATLVLAEISYWVIERPIRRYGFLTPLLRRKPRAIDVGPGLAVPAPRALMSGAVERESVGSRAIGRQSVGGQAWAAQGPDGRGLIGQPAMGQPATGQPATGQPAMGQPAMGQPGTAQVASGRNPTSQHAMGQPAMGQPAMGQPGTAQGASGRDPTRQLAPDRHPARKGSSGQRTAGQRASGPLTAVGRATVASASRSPAPGRGEGTAPGRTTIEVYGRAFATRPSRLLVARTVFLAVALLVGGTAAGVGLSSAAARPITGGPVDVGPEVTLGPLLPVAPTPTPTSTPSVPASTAPPPPLALGSTVAFFGDSQGMTLLLNKPADIAKFIKPVDATIPGCGILLGVAHSRTGENHNLTANCRNWQPAWSASVTKIKPALAVVMVGAWDVFDLTLDGGAALPFGGPDWDANFEAQVTKGVDILRTSNVPVALALLPCYRPVRGSAGFWPERGDDVRTRHVNDLLTTVAGRYPSGLRTLTPPPEFCTDPKISTSLSYRWDGVHYYKPGAALYFSAILPQLMPS
jgi:peptidoglycan/LPS O-acetylase OafA/YrhL